MVTAALKEISTNVYYVREKVKKFLCSRQMRNWLLSKRNPQTCNKWREKRGHVVTLAVQVLRKRGAKSL